MSNYRIIKNGNGKYVVQRKSLIKPGWDVWSPEMKTLEEAKECLARWKDSRALAETLRELDRRSKEVVEVIEE